MSLTKTQPPPLTPLSVKRLASCHPQLRTLFEQVARIIPCTILEGHRDQATQDAAFAGGKSKVKWPHGKHNRQPAEAIDAAPLPIDWNDRERFCLFAGVVLGIAAQQGVRLRWGGDWDQDFQVTDNRFDDLVHFELMEG